VEQYHYLIGIKINEFLTERKVSEVYSAFSFVNSSKFRVAFPLFLNISSRYSCICFWDSILSSNFSL